VPKLEEAYFADSGLQWNVKMKLSKKDFKSLMYFELRKSVPVLTTQSFQVHCYNLFHSRYSISHSAIEYLVTTFMNDFADIYNATLAKQS
jgi:hypothetical protein